MPRIMPEARYFSIPSTDAGAEVLRNRALNCWPWVRSLTQLPVPYPLPGRDRRGVADQRHQLALAPGLHPQDAKAILGVLVSHALDQSGEHLLHPWPRE